MCWQSAGFLSIISVMGFFLDLFFFIYSLLHLYLFVKAKAALSLGAGTCIPLALFMILMITAPVIARLSEHAGFVPLARFVAYTGYTWMALLFLFFCISFTIDLCRLALYAACQVMGRAQPGPPSPPGRISCFASPPPLPSALTAGSRPGIYGPAA